MKSRILVIFSVLPCVLVGMAATSAKAADSAVSVSVQVIEPWTDSGVYVNAGDSVSITASGVAVFGSGDKGTKPAGAQGCAGTDDDSIPPGPFLAPGLTCRSLIGRIGAGAPFEIGAGTSFTATSSGELDLGVNDNYFPDNHGTWTVTIAAVSQP